MYGVSGGWVGDRERERNSESSKGREQELFADKEQERRQVRGKRGKRRRYSVDTAGESLSQQWSQGERHRAERGREQEGESERAAAGERGLKCVQVYRGHSGTELSV